MPRIEFEADTEEQLLALAWRWVMGPQHRPGELVPDQTDQADLRRRQLGEVLNAIRGADSRRLLREVAELSTRDEALVLDAGLTPLRETLRDGIRRHCRRSKQGDATGGQTRPDYLGRRCARVSHGPGGRGDRAPALAGAPGVIPAVRTDQEA